MFSEIKIPNELSNGGKTIFSIGTSPNVIYLSKNSSTQNTFQLGIQSPSGFNFVNTSEINTPTIKLVISYKNGDNAFYANGVLISSASAVSNPTGMSQSLIGDTTPSTNTDIKIKQALLFKTRLTNAELVALTTI